MADADLTARLDVLAVLSNLLKEFCSWEKIGSCRIRILAVRGFFCLAPAQMDGFLEV